MDVGEQARMIFARRSDAPLSGSIKCLRAQIKRNGIDREVAGAQVFLQSVAPR